MPKELQDTIVSYLDDRSRRPMRSTSTNWFKLINYDHFRIYFARSSNIPDIVKTFSRYSKPIGLEFTKTIEAVNKYSYMMLAALTNLTMLQIEPRKHFIQNLTVADQIHFSTLTALQRLSIGQYNMLPYSRHFTNLTYLEAQFGFSDFKPDVVDNLQHLPRLEHLKLSLPYIGVTLEQQFNVIAKLGNCSALKSLELEDDVGVLQFDSKTVAKMSNLSKVSVACRDVVFPFNQLPNLESLRISSDRFDDFSMSTKLTFLSIEARGTKGQPPIISAKTHDYQQLTALTSLKVLELKLSLQDEQYSFMNKLTKLEILSVKEKDINNVELTGEFLLFVNSSSLTRLDIPTPHNASHVSHFTNLREIYFCKPANRETNFAPFDTLTSVTRLHCHGVPSILRHMPNLKRLRLQNEVYQPDFSRHSILSSLSQLESFGTTTVDNNVLQLVTGHINLTELSCTLQRVEGQYDFDGLARLTKLKKLALQCQAAEIRMNCDTLWAAIDKLTNLEQLEMFHIDENSVKVLEHLPHLKELSVQGPEAQNFVLQFSIEEQLSRLTNLQTLAFTGQFIFDHSSDLPLTLDLPYLYQCKISV